MAIVSKTANSASFRNSRRWLTVALALYFIYTFIPIFYVIVSSTKSNADLFGTFGLWFSGDFHFWQNLQDLFTYQDGIFSRWLLNTILYSVVSGVGAALFATFAGYAFSKFEFVGKKLSFALVLGAVMIPQTALVIPIFLLLSKVGLVNTPWAVILPSLVFPPGVFLMKVYADDALSNELIEAGRVDGAGEVHIFFNIAFRLLTPGFATVLILAFVATWNNYFLPLVLLNSSDNFPVTVGLSQWYALATSGSGGAVLFSIVMAGSLVSIVPVIAAFLIMQRYWQGGLGAGGVKA
ncbi:MAG: Sugar transporter permease [Devosia sp.]|uniref:carbohydrate ABC transporter permease n=1 Tax=Devosia sp. TaxID=1871048 RepID=UPI00263421A1|nr:carbohydrate ABC transporter permease [Devosia sp.]MDB5527460.1 Sugar transporter permease [Devosia sp.]MDB5586101.1 Sugar transporter permease [Devosia sp.]